MSELRFVGEGKSLTSASDGMCRAHSSKEKEEEEEREEEGTDEARNLTSASSPQWPQLPT